MPSVVVKGLKQLQKQFEQFDKDMHANLKDALKGKIQTVSKEAKEALYKGHGVETEEYKRSISWRVSKTGLIAWAYASRRKMNDDKSVSNKGYIGHLLEYGTVKTAAIPHFGPAMDRARATFGADLENAVRKVRGIRGVV